MKTKIIEPSQLNDVLKIDGSAFGENGISGTNDVFVKRIIALLL